MKSIINVKPREHIVQTQLYDSLIKARNSWDYVQINFGRQNQFLKIAFCKDQSYVIGYNFYNLMFTSRLKVLLTQYPKNININKLSDFIITTIDKLNQ